MFTLKIERPRAKPFKLKDPTARTAKAVGHYAIGSFALGALATAAMYVGSLAIGRFAVGRLAVREGRIKRLRIDELEVGRFKVTQKEPQAVASPNGSNAKVEMEVAPTANRLQGEGQPQ